MSDEAISRFFRMLNDTPELRAEFKTALEGAVVGLAARHGCEFTADELALRLSDELSDEDLEDVAGGASAPITTQDLSSEMLLSGLTRGLAGPDDGISSDASKW